MKVQQLVGSTALMEAVGNPPNAKTVGDFVKVREALTKHLVVHDLS